MSRCICQGFYMPPNCPVHGRKTQSEASAHSDLMEVRQSTLVAVRQEVEKLERYGTFLYLDDDRSGSEISTSEDGDYITRSEVLALLDRLSSQS